MGGSNVERGGFRLDTLEWIFKRDGFELFLWVWEKVGMLGWIVFD